MRRAADKPLQYSYAEWTALLQASTPACLPACLQTQMSCTRVRWIWHVDVL